MKLKIGCCGFPQRKKEYFKKFRVVEVQQTFYQPPRVTIVKKWREAAPENFEFTLKAWQLITHEPTSPTYRKLKMKLTPSAKKNCGFFKPTDEVFRAWEETAEAAAALKAKTIVFQCPPSFRSVKANRDNMRKFFKTIKRARFRLVWEPRAPWHEKDIRQLCEELDLVHCADPFSGSVLHGRIRYFRLHGIGGYNYKYRGIDLKRLRDLCEKEAKHIRNRPIYVLFNNVHMLSDAQRFEWIAKHTGPLKELNLAILQSLCHEIEAREEDEKVQLLSREAERIVMLILHTDYAKVDIEIEKGKLREMCKRLFPDKAYLYDMIYGQRFDRLWEQFRETDV